MLGNNSSSCTRILEDRTIHTDFRAKAQDGLESHILPVISVYMHTIPLSIFSLLRGSTI